MTLETAREWFGRRWPAVPTRRASGPESENPYLSARRTWNSYVGAEVAARRFSQMVALLSLLIALAGVGGVAYIGSRAKYIPYVIEVDRLGQASAMGPVTAAAHADPRVLRASVSEFIRDARGVTPDVSLQRRAVERVYAMLSPNDPATAKMTEWLNGTEDRNPFVRATKEMVSVEIESVLQQSPETWQVDWTETTRDRQGTVQGPPVAMRALVSVYAGEPSSSTTEDEMLKNPLGILVHDFSWSAVRVKEG